MTAHAAGDCAETAYVGGATGGEESNSNVRYCSNRAFGAVIVCTSTLDVHPTWVARAPARSRLAAATRVLVLMLPWRAFSVPRDACDGSRAIPRGHRARSGSGPARRTVSGRPRAGCAVVRKVFISRAANAG